MPTATRPTAEDNARVRAFCALYEAEFGRCSAAASLERSESATPMSEERSERARTLVGGVEAHVGELDALIDETADRLPPERIALIDRAILRIALYEMLFDNGAVRSNTAVRHGVSLAKRFGGDGSRRFVTGVLSTISRNRQDGTAE